MCEILMLASPEPFTLDLALTAAEQLERDGKAGHGWGVAWVPGRGERMRLIKRPRAIIGDAEAQTLRGEQAIAVLIHLRMPSDMDMVGMPDTQPFHDDDAGTAFAHNGFLPEHGAWRPHYAAALEGRADSEVGWQHFRRHHSSHGLEGALRRVAQDVGGQDGFANLAVLDADGSIHILCVNSRNRVCELREGTLAGFATSVHRDDESGLRLIFPRAALTMLPIGAYGVIAPEPAQV